MLVAVFVLAALQLSGISGETCPPESGIYLVHNGVCVSDNTFFQATDLYGMGNELHCLLANSDNTVTSAQGRWMYPDENPVNCDGTENANLGPFGCSITNQSDGVRLYKHDQLYSLSSEHSGVYTCCLPESCSDGSSSQITVRIYGTQIIVDAYVIVPGDVTVLPQTYTVHCVINEECDCVQNSSSIQEHFFMEGSFADLASQFCGQEQSLSCTEKTNSSVASSVDHQLIVTWTASDVIAEGSYSTIDTTSNGDHDFFCYASYTSSVDGLLTDENAVAFVRAPNFIPSNLKAVTTTDTNVTLGWVVPTFPPPDADGYVIYYFQTDSELVMVEKFADGDATNYTLGGLTPNTSYTFSMRAYQDILGPSSGKISVTTNTSEVTLTTTLPSMVAESSIAAVYSTSSPSPVVTPSPEVTAVSMLMTTSPPPMATPSPEVPEVSVFSTSSPSPMVTPSPEVPDVSFSISLVSFFLPSLPLPMVTSSPEVSVVSVFSTSSPSPMATPSPEVSDVPVFSTSSPVPMVTPSPEETDAIVSLTSTPSPMVTQSSETKGTTFSAIPTSEADESSGSLLSVILAFALISLVFLIAVVVIIIIIVYRKKKAGKYNVKNSAFYSEYALQRKDVVESSTVPFEDNKNGKNEVRATTAFQDTPVLIVEQESVPLMEFTDGSVPAKIQSPAKVPFDPKIPVTIPVTIDDLASHVEKCHAYDDDPFVDQYRKLYFRDVTDCSIGFSNENKPLNRFRDVAPYDDNRILLKGFGYDSNPGGYINASYIDGFTCAKKFIAAQGPMDNTVDDFWRMVWQERTQIIVMTTKLVEGGKPKCEMYWPASQSGPQRYGPFRVSLVDEQEMADIVIRKLKIWVGEDTEYFLPITQYQFMSWPDHGIPEHATPLMTLHQCVMVEWRNVGGPVLVHCSAGVGRTGTFIAMDIALEQAKRKGEVDIAGIVNRLRQQRMRMIQTDVQYVFLHDLVLECLLCGNTEIPCKKFSMEMNELKKVDPESGKSRMEQQFEKLNKVCLPPDEHLLVTAKQHSEKNRTDQYLPSDRWRVVLFQETPGYINATYVNGYDMKRPFIIAQSPMENTVRDFWKMATDNKVPAIVMLLDTTEEDEYLCDSYWTSKEDYSVVESSRDEQEGIVRRKLEITKGDVVHPLTHFQVLGWPANGQVKDVNNILSVVEEVMKLQEVEGGRPVIVHCSDTVSRSGVFCALSYALEQCKLKQVVDVFQAVKSIRIQKTGAVTSAEQYSSIYDLVNSYILKNSST